MTNIVYHLIPGEGALIAQPETVAGNLKIKQQFLEHSPFISLHKFQQVAERIFRTFFFSIFRRIFKISFIERFQEEKNLIK